MAGVLTYQPSGLGSNLAPFYGKSSSLGFRVNGNKLKQKQQMLDGIFQHLLQLGTRISLINQAWPSMIKRRSKVFEIVSFQQDSENSLLRRLIQTRYQEDFTFRKDGSLAEKQHYTSSSRSHGLVVRVVACGGRRPRFNSNPSSFCSLTLTISDQTANEGVKRSSIVSLAK